MIILEFLMTWLILSAVISVVVFALLLWFEALIYITEREFIFFKSTERGTLITLPLLIIWFTFPLSVAVTLVENLS